MNRIHAAVVGTGFIGPVHVEAIRRLGHEVIGILGSSESKSRQTAETLGLAKGYASFLELLADPLVQVVHLASPNRLHFEQCQLALAAGKHVVCEKPLAMSSTESARLVELARAAPLIAAVNYNVRFYPLLLECKERIRLGKLGAILHVTGSYLQDWLLHETDFNWRVLAEEGGELRAVADIGTHLLDTVSFVTGLKVEAVCADLQIVHPTRLRPTGVSETFTRTGEAVEPSGTPVAISTEDAAFILVKFVGGARGCFSVSQVTAGRKNCLRFDIAGRNASFAWDSEEPNALQIGYRNQPNQRLTRDPALLDERVSPFADYPGGHAEGFPDSFKQLYKAIYKDIAEVIEGWSKPKEPLYATFEDGHQEVLLCEAILKSHREQCWVRVPATETRS